MIIQVRASIEFNKHYLGNRLRLGWESIKLQATSYKQRATCLKLAASRLWLLAGTISKFIALAIVIILKMV